MADYTQLMNLEKQRKEHHSPSSVQPTPPHQSIAQSTNPSIDQSMNQSIDQSTSKTSNKVMEKPRGFYITEQVNQRIDEAVRYYQEKHHLNKVDRSIVVTVLLENEAIWTEEALDGVLNRVIGQLTKRLTSR
jgi:hypothetical protein